MPFKPSDAKDHTHKASSPTAARQWAHVAEGTRTRLLAEGRPEAEAAAAAVIAANGVVADRRPETHAHPSKVAPTKHPHGRPR